MLTSVSSKYFESTISFNLRDIRQGMRTYRIIKPMQV